MRARALGQPISTTVSIQPVGKRAHLLNDGLREIAELSNELGRASVERIVGVDVVKVQDVLGLRVGRRKGEGR